MLPNARSSFLMAVSNVNLVPNILRRSLVVPFSAHLTPYNISSWLNSLFATKLSTSCFKVGYWLCTICIGLNKLFCSANWHSISRFMRRLTLARNCIVHQSRIGCVQVISKKQWYICNYRCWAHQYKYCENITHIQTHQLNLDLIVLHSISDNIHVDEAFDDMLDARVPRPGAALLSSLIKKRVQKDIVSTLENLTKLQNQSIIHYPLSMTFLYY